MTVVQERQNGARSRLGVGLIIVLVLAAVVITVGVGIVRTLLSPPAVVPSSSATEVATGIAPAGLFVHVAGAVNEPGLYELYAGARVFDAVASAGGFAEDAAQDAVNLARVVTDGEQIAIPRLGEEPVTTGGVSADGKVNLNTADAGELETLPRIGPTLAQRIIDWRTENGSFGGVDDLLEVPGIGEKLVAGLRDAVTV